MNKQNAHGVVAQPANRRTDYLYRVSLKCVICNERGEVLVVKERGRDWWDLPGGGMDHGERIKDAIAREMKEEVNLRGDFEYNVIAVDEPAHLGEHNFWQIRLIFVLRPRNFAFSAGDDGDEIKFVDPRVFKNAANSVERRIYEYAQKAHARCG